MGLKDRLGAWFRSATPPTDRSPAPDAPLAAPAPHDVHWTPPTTPLPAGRYLFLVEAIPPNYAGRTSSILAKIQAFSTQPGVDCEIVVIGYSADLPRAIASIRARHVIDASVPIRALYDLLDPTGTETEPGEVVEHIADDGHRAVDDVSARGIARHSCRYAPGDAKPVAETFRDSTGRLLFRRTRTADDQTPGRVRDTVLVGSGAEEDEAMPWPVFLRSLLDRLVGEHPGPVFASVEARVVDRITLGWRNRDVRQVYVLHNPHLLPPYDDVDRIRGGFKGVLSRGGEVTTVFLTQAQRADAEAHYGPSDTWWVIPHAARQTAPPTGEPRDPGLIVMVGRLHSQKQMSLAIRAMAQVTRAVPGARLEIYGEGDQEVELQELISELGMEASIRLAGYTTNVDAVYQRATLSLLTSEYEGLGLVLVESLANGCPTIACDVRYGPADIVTDGVNGRLTPAGSVAALAEAIVSCLNDPVGWAAMSRAAPDIRSRFSRELFLNRWATLYRSLA